MQRSEGFRPKESGSKSSVLALLFIGCSMLGTALLLAVWSGGPWH
jgi:hypothetical protein